MLAYSVETARVTPSPCGRIVELGAAHETSATTSSRHQHLARGQQCRRVKRADGVETAGVTPIPCTRIVEFGATHETSATTSSGHHHLAPGQQRRRPHA